MVEVETFAEPLAPDVSEEEAAGKMDDPIPAAGYRLTRVVALGGSAGGIQALRQFFGAMPSDSGMAFVVILHLAPEHESSLSQILQKATAMSVEQATDGRKVLPNHVYVIPPGKHLSLTDGHLRLTKLEREHGKRLTVDLFFRSLADTHGPHAVAVVLSGADGDGANGIKRIKERGGLTIAQEPEQAEHPSMPRAAIGTRMVDWILEVEQIPAHLLRFGESEQRLELPSELGPNPVVALRPNPSVEEAALVDVLALVHSRTGRNFSYYKRATIVRRIARRMQVNGVDDLPSYLTYLGVHPGEAGALLQDLLISVTNFFRDREAFEALEAQVVELFHGKAPTDTVRVWVPACASGEEAYSIAILLSEFARTLQTPPALQVFATDLDEQVLQEARRGFYSASIANDVSEERLQRYFVKEHHGYRVRAELRETVLFAVHDLLKDSPFSRLDLVSCRNLLIYLNEDAQKRALDTFHFALRPEGRLFLGASESVTGSSSSFDAIDKKHRIYSARVTGRTQFPVPRPSAGPLTFHRARGSFPAPAAGVFSGSRTEQMVAPLHLHSSRPSWSELHLKLAEQLGPPSMIVNAEHEILHLSESAGPFLKFAGGEPSANLIRAAHPALRVELRAALSRAHETGQVTTAKGITIDLGEGAQRADVRVAPALAPGNDLFLVTLHLREASKSDVAGGAAREQEEPLVRQLERQLDQMKQHWREVVEEHELSAEELKASNEELQAINEELRSATEELETSREELQSINEELTTVNHELKGNLEELGQTNSDLRNLMGATAIATIFLDRDLRIMRFTPSAVELFSLIPGDIGRPLAHLRHRLVYPELLTDAAQVLEHLSPIERQVGESEGRFFLARLLPYRDSEDRIAGVVLTFVNVTELRVAQDSVKRAHQDLELRVQDRTTELDAANAALRREIHMHQEATRARQDLQTRLVNAQEEERSRISRELHDEVGQQITALMLAMKSLETTPPNDETAAKWRGLRAAAEEVGREVHQLASELRPVALDELGLPRALSGYLDSWATRHGISVDFVCVGIDEPRLPRAIETTIYRIVQEALNNVYKHADAKTVSVSIERRGGSALAIVEDDGAGFDSETSQAGDPSRLGIAGMKERTTIVGGTLTIESGRSGTTVRVQIPVAPAEHTE